MLQLLILRLYTGTAVLSNKTIAVFKNQYIDSITNSGVIDRTKSLTMLGELTAGTATISSSSSCKCGYGGEFISFALRIQWEFFTGGTGI